MICNPNQKNYRPDEQRRTSRWQLATLAERDPCRWRYLLFFFAKIWTSLSIFSYAFFSTFWCRPLIAAWRDRWHQHHPAAPPPHRHGCRRRPRPQGGGRRRWHNTHNSNLHQRLIWQLSTNSTADTVPPNFKMYLDKNLTKKPPVQYTHFHTYLLRHIRWQ